MAGVRRRFEGEGHMTTDFGLDTSCTRELRTGRLVSGPRLAAEAAYRRLTTPRAMLRGGEEEANYGYDITELVGKGASVAPQVPQLVSSELLKDERIETVDVDVVVATDGPAVSFTITIAATTKEGPFALTLAVSAVTVDLLGIKTEGT